MTKREHIDRMPKAAMIRASVLTPLRQHILEHGICYENFLLQRGMHAEDFIDPYAVLPLARYIALFEDAAQALDDPSLGLRIGMRLQPADIGPMGALFSLSSTLQAAFERLSVCVRSLQGATLSAMMPLDHDFVWSYRITAPNLWPRRQETEYTLAACCQLVRACFAANWRPLEVHFEHPNEGDTTLLQKIFRAPLHFNQSGNRLIVDGTEARHSFRIEDTGLTRILERHVADLSSNGTGDGTLGEQVQALIELHVGEQQVTLETVAHELALNPRTLQRRLSAEGLSFRIMLQSYLNALARERLSNGNARMSDVAQTLGYADGTVLWRAYKRWEGKAPSKYKRR